MVSGSVDPAQYISSYPTTAPGCKTCDTIVSERSPSMICRIGGDRAADTICPLSLVLGCCYSTNEQHWLAAVSEPSFMFPPHVVT